jgi:hypothetical protein
VLEADAGSVAVEASAAHVGGGDILARGRGDDDVGELAEVGQKASCRESCDVVIELGVREVGAVDPAPPGIEFACGKGPEARPLHAQAPAAAGA